MPQWLLKPSPLEVPILDGHNQESGWVLRARTARSSVNTSIIVPVALCSPEDQRRNSAPWKSDVELMVIEEAAAAVKAMVAVAPTLDTTEVARALSEIANEAEAQQPDPQRKSVAAAAIEEQESREPPGFVALVEGDDGTRTFLLRDDQGDFHLEEKVTGLFRGVMRVHVPPTQVPWTLPRATEVLKHLPDAEDPAFGAQLFTDLEAYYRAASDLGHESAYPLMSSYTMQSYIIEHFDYVGFIALEAVPERGKSRAGKAAMRVMRHGIASVSLREAHLIRDARDRQASLFYDIRDLWARAEQENCDDLLLARWERDLQVPRVVHPQLGPHRDTEWFSTFGPTILATNVPLHRVLGSRCFVIVPPLTRDSKKYRGQGNRDAARELTERLTAWRAVSLRATLPKVEVAAPGRLGDILEPIKQIMAFVVPDRLAEFDALVKWQAEIRGANAADSWEARIITAIDAARDEVETDRNGTRFVPVEVLMEAINADVAPRDQRTTYWVAKQLRLLSWTVTRMGRARKLALVADDELLERLVAAYSAPREEENA